MSAAIHSDWIFSTVPFPGVASEVACEARHSRPAGKFRWRLAGDKAGQEDIWLQTEEPQQVEEEQGGFFFVKQVGDFTFQ